MISPYLKSRVYETCDTSLQNWYNANIQEAGKSCYNDNPFCRQIMLDEARFIKDELKRRGIVSFS